MNLSENTDGPFTATADFLTGGGETGALIREMDWTQTGLGAPQNWPQSLKTAVRIMLSSRFPMFVWWGPGLINLYNDAYVPILGRRHPWAMGRPAPEVWQDIWPSVGPQAELVLNKGEATWNDESLLVMQRFGYAEETYFTFSYSPLPDESGGVGGVFCACKEDTERVIGQRRVQALRHLTAHTARARTTEDACRLSIEALAQAQHDLPFTLLYLANADYSEATLVASSHIDPQSPFAPALIPLTAESESSPWRLSEATGNESMTVSSIQERQLPGGPWPEPSPCAVVLPLRMGAPDRPGGFLIAGVSPRRPLDDSYRGFFELVAAGITSAITNAQAYEDERRRAESLAELDRAKTRFFSNISHEFRTPLTLLLGPLEDLLSKPTLADVPEGRASVELAHRNALRLLRLVNTLLDFSRLEAGREKASFQATDLARLTTEIASGFRSAIERAGLQFTVDCEALPEPAYVDPDMWEKIVLNLLSNAFKFTFAGRIAVTLRASGGQAEFAVSDTGVGIPPAEQAHLFERFYRSEASRGRTHEGTGIGLAFIKELVTLHGGQIAVESTPGVGTTFRVSFPLGTSHLPADRIVQATEAKQAVPPADLFVEEALRWLPSHSIQSEGDSAEALEPARTSSREGRILLADDNADMRDYLRRLLAGHYEVTTAANGEEALAAARQSPPDVILTDVMMPGLDGFGLLRELRKDTHTSKIPVILLSARAGEDSRVEGMEAGADDYLVKPFTARELLARVGAHLHLSKLRTRAEEGLRQSEERFRHMADHAPVMVWVTDSKGMCTYLSRSWYEFTGQTPAEGLGFGWLEAVHPDNRDDARESFLRSNTNHEPFRADYRLRRADGEWRWVIDAAVPRFAQDGTYLGYIGSVIDITERKRMEDELRNTNRELEEFAFVASHDLQEPLRMVNIYTQLLMRKHVNQGSEEAREYAEFVRKGVLRMEALIRDLLSYSRTVHQDGTRLSPTDVNHSLAQALAVLKGRIDETGATISADPLPIVCCDQTQLAYVFQNLLSNSLKYRHEQRPLEISITSHRLGEDWVISVTDNGIGFEQRHADRVFGLFKRLHKDAYPGTGLGLAICKRIIERCGGRIWATAAPDEGATFTFSLTGADSRPS